MEANSIQFTIKNIDKDFVEWHRNIPYYAFWALKIKDGHWLNKIAEFQNKLAPYLIDNDKRQAHLTVFTCGLTHFTKKDQGRLATQRSLIERLKLKSFSLSIREFSSFTGSPVLLPNHIQSNTLQQLRQALLNFQDEDRIQDFRPHITLGLYNQVVPLDKIYECVKHICLKKINPIVIDEVYFCLYETKSIKGPIQFKTSVKLN